MEDPRHTGAGVGGGVWGGGREGVASFSDAGGVFSFDEVSRVRYAVSDLLLREEDSSVPWQGKLTWGFSMFDSCGAGVCRLRLDNTSRRFDTIFFYFVVALEAGRVIGCFPLLGGF